MFHNATQTAPAKRKTPLGAGWSLLTVGLVFLIFALIAYQIGHEVASNIRATNGREQAPLAPAEQLPVAATPSVMALPPSNKPRIATNPPATPPTNKRQPAPAATAKPAAPRGSVSQPKPTTKPS